MSHEIERTESRILKAIVKEMGVDPAMARTFAGPELGRLVEAVERRADLASRVLRFLESHPGAFRAEIARAVGGVHRRREEVVRALVRSGQVRTEAEKAGIRHWLVTA